MNKAKFAGHDSINVRNTTISKRAGHARRKNADRIRGRSALKSMWIECGFKIFLWFWSKHGGLR